MPDLTDLPGQTKPKIFGAPMGPEASVAATDRNKPTQATDAQVKAAYQAYMRQVVSEAHKHFAEHLQSQQAPAGNAPTPMATSPSTAAVPLGTGIADQGGRLVSGRQQQIDKAVDAAQ